MFTVIHIPSNHPMGEFETTQAARQWIRMGDADEWHEFKVLDENGQEVQLPFMDAPRR